MKYKPYPAYKDSGVEWAPQAPIHWTVTPLLAVADERDDSNRGMKETNLLSLSYGEIVTKDINDNDGLLPESFETYQIIEADDIVWRLTDLQNDKRSLRTALSTQRGIITSAYLATRVKAAKARFVAYQLRSYDTTKVFYSMGGGLRQSMKYSDVKRLPMMLPTREEQTTIANFLDRETAKLDTLIAKQEKLIELLQEKRQALISHAVTKGLDPNVKMKDSGVEWLGKVPEHWEVCAIKRMTDLITDGAHVSPETEGGVYEFVSTKDISESGIDFDGCLKTSPKSYELMVKTGCRPISGDVLFSKDGTVGRTTVIKEQRDFAVASSLIIIRPNSQFLNSNYLHYLCQCSALKQQVDSFVKGAGLPRLSIQNLLKVFGVFAPIDEQNEISNCLDRETAKLDTLIEKSRRSIELMREHRTALISAAVTGKIDVREAA